MALPAVSWNIDGLDTPLQGWSAGTTAFGGFSQMRGVIRESDARRYPSTVGQGSVVTGYTQGGLVVYQGRLSAPPAIRGGLATFAAQGESVRAAKRATRLLYQSRDVSLWTDIASPPHGATNTRPEALHIQVNPGGILFDQVSGVSTGSSGSTFAGAAFWAPGQNITRVAYDWLSSFAGTDWKLELLTTIGPTPGGSIQTSTAMGATTFSVDASWGTGADQVHLQQVYRAAAATMGSGNTLIKNLRVNGIANTGDQYWSWQLFQDVGGRLGYDTTGVTATGLNVLPLDWTQGSWAELLSYIATLDDRYWGVYEDAKLKNPLWGDREWTVYQADGATVDLTPLELYNQVTVKYVDVGGAPREVTVSASPDPLAASGIVNVWTESLSDVQADATLATAVANNLLPRVSTLREQGRINAVKAYDSTGREAVREIRAGDTVRVADRDMNTATLHRVFETDQDSEGVACGIETGVSIASLLGRAGLVSARAPSTAELPELEIAAVEAGPGEPAPYANRYDWYAKWASPDRGVPDKRLPGGKGGKLGGRTGGLGKKGRKLY